MLDPRFAVAMAIHSEICSERIEDAVVQPEIHQCEKTVVCWAVSRIDELLRPS